MLFVVAGIYDLPHLLRNENNTCKLIYQTLYCTGNLNLYSFVAIGHRRRVVLKYEGA